MVGIYKITSPSGKAYIGQSINIDQRFDSYRRNSCKGQRILFASLLKYGADSHEFKVIHELPFDASRSVLNSYEEAYIKQYKECGFDLMNLTGGGYSNKDLSKETRALISKSKIGNTIWLGRKHSEESKEKIRQGNTGKVFDEKRRANISKSLTGKQGSNLGKKFSEEHRRKISESRIELFKKRRPQP